MKKGEIAMKRSPNYCKMVWVFLLMEFVNFACEFFHLEFLPILT